MVIVPSQKHPMIAVDMYQVPIMSILFSELFCALVLRFDRGPLSLKFFLCFPVIIVVFFFNYETLK